MVHFSICACHLCAGAVLSFFPSSQFLEDDPRKEGFTLNTTEARIQLRFAGAAFQVHHALPGVHGARTSDSGPVEAAHQTLENLVKIAVVDFDFEQASASDVAVVRGSRGRGRASGRAGGRGPRQRGNAPTSGPLGAVRIYVGAGCHRRPAFGRAWSPTSCADCSRSEH